MASDSECQQDRQSWQAEYMQMFVTNQRRIHAFIRTIVPSKPDSEDILQETSITGWSKYADVAASLHGAPESFVSWICTIARFEALKHYRKKQSHMLPFSESLLNELADRQQQQSEHLELRYQALAICVQKLSQTDRELLQRRYEFDAKPQQIADQIGRPVNSVYKGLQRIRAALMTCIERVLHAEGFAR